MGALIDCHVEEELSYGLTDRYVTGMRELADAYGSADMVRIGASEYGEDIYALDLKPSGEVRGQVFVVAGHHSTEPAGPEAAMAFARRYLESDTELAQQLKENVRVTVIPVVNVDMYALPLENRPYDTLNSGYDGKRGKWMEERAVMSCVEERTADVPYRLAFDIHETDTEIFHGFGVIQFEPGDDGEVIIKPEKDYGRAAAERIEREGYRLIHSDKDMGNDGLLPEEKATPMCFDGYSAAKGAYAYTFETPSSHNTMRERVEMDLIGMDELFARVFAEPDASGQ